MLRLAVIFSILLLVIFLLSCKTKAPKAIPETAFTKAQRIVDQSIKAHGANLLNHAILEFTFRAKEYVTTHKGAEFQYERRFINKDGKKIKDVLTNEVFYRSENEQQISLTEKQKASWSGSLNSVNYFVQLPYRLNDGAVIKKYVGESTIKGRKYDKVEVRFKEEGGGEDHEDVYMYWFDQNTHTMDYLAYNFLVNGGGARFRAAYNPRIIDGIRFVDYINYKPKEDNRDVFNFDQLYEQDDLKELSRIDTENVRVRLNQ